MCASTKASSAFSRREPANAWTACSSWPMNPARGPLSDMALECADADGPPVKTARTLPTWRPSFAQAPV
eukprot:1004629-Alexandrium_andersonii.AAC.1